MVLLALAPFLHGHLGASHVSGFHVDGVDVAHKVSSQAAFGSSSDHALDDEDSPALGVSESLPQTGGDAPLVWTLVAMLLWVCLAHAAQTSGLRLRLVVARLAPRAYQSGWPPPALAPPL
jgi:hypothetical protein